MTRHILRIRSCRHRQGGMVTLIVTLFLVATVVFMLTKALGVSSNNVVDSLRQEDGHAAFFLAESGLERGAASVASALSGSYTSASCTGIGSTYNLGRGSVTITGTSSPSTCDNAGSPTCTACTVTATGTVGIASRTLTQEQAMTVRNGTFCTSNCGNNPVTWQLNLKNTSGYAGVGVFNLSYEEQGNNQASCPGGSVCRLQVDVDSPAAGTNSIGLMANTWEVAAGETKTIYQLMSQGSRSVVEVGVFFLGSSAAPTLTGPSATAGGAAYWDMRNSQPSGQSTVGTDSESTGATNDGTWSNSGTCSAPTNANNSAQSCTRWCRDGDTLVYLFSGNPKSLDAQLTSVTFGTNVHSVPLTRVVRYPQSGIPGAPTNAHAETWYARNANLTGTTTDVTGVSSYKGRGTAAVGAQWTSNSNDDTVITTSGTAGNGTLTIASTSGFQGSWPTQMILPGDTISMTQGATTVTATIGAQSASTEAGGLTTGQGGRGTYAASNIRSNGVLVTTTNTTFNGNNRTWIVSSTVLNVSSCSICFMAQSDPVTLTGLSAGRTINASQNTPATAYGRTEVQGGIGRYPLSGTATRVASNTGLLVGTPNETLYLAASSTAFPSVTTPAMYLKVVSPTTGAFAAASTVAAVSAPGSPNSATRSFTMSAAPSTALVDATVCAGTCAFFNSGATASTNFSMSNVASNFNGWAGGFLCLKGVDLVPQIVSSSTSTATRWTEVVN